jgi:hypothetical protein
VHVTGQRACWGARAEVAISACPAAAECCSFCRLDVDEVAFSLQHAAPVLGLNALFS